MNKFLLLCVTTLLIVGCGKLRRDAEVRVYNATNANLFWKFGGCKFGEATYNGQLNTTEITVYRDVEAGAYPVEFMNEYGQWVPVTAKKLEVEPGKQYTLWILGTLDTKPDSKDVSLSNTKTTTFLLIEEDE